ncbi:MAG: hypothetical protein RL222_1816, partial [Bacteroidota bacterium]
NKKNIGLSNFWFVVNFILTIIAFIYLFKSRLTSEIVKYTLYIAIPIAIIFFFIYIYFWIKDGFRKPNISILIYATFIIPFASLSYYALAVSVKDIYLWAQSPTFTKSTTIILTVLITAIIGLLLFYFRLRLRSIYGFTEAIFGLIIAGNKIAIQNNLDILNSEFYLTLLTAAIYLVVRGLDNIHQGLTKDPIDPIGIKIFNFLKQS